VSVLLVGWTTISRSVRIFVVFSAAFLTACGGDGTGPESDFETLVGTYEGSIVGVSLGVVLSANLSLTFEQTGGILSGGYSLNGILSEGESAAPLQGVGTFTGTIAAGQNPAVTVSLSSRCPNFEANFFGGYSSADDLLTLIGPVDVLLDDCTLILRYVPTISLSR
jgi:hypothetical protein